jgi:hypothetical protein
MLIPDPDFYPSRIPDLGSQIPDPKTATKDVATNFTIVNYFSFEVLKKKIWANFQRIIELFTKKIVKAHKNMVLGSGIRDAEKIYSGSRIQGSKSTQSRIPDPDPQHWFYVYQ